MRSLILEWLLLMFVVEATLFQANGSRISASTLFANDVEPKQWRLSKGDDGDWKFVAVANIDTASVRRMEREVRNLRIAEPSVPSPQRALEDHHNH
uniref:Uncharacterized protein n=1 Tax=Chenopodium quinoa TaxID=63459 RepID=A0A803L8H6_CHEQI